MYIWTLFRSHSPWIVVVFLSSLLIVEQADGQVLDTEHSPNASPVHMPRVPVIRVADYSPDGRLVEPAKLPGTLPDLTDPAKKAELVEYLAKNFELKQYEARQAESMQHVAVVQQEDDGEDETALIAQGRMAFESSCTICHDAARSTEKAKSLAGWMSTVRRMAAKNGADVPGGDFTAIATYLASLSSPQAGQSGGEGDDAAATSDAAANPFSLNATLSPLWRGTNDERRLENPDWFVDAWVTASWQPQGAFQATVTACTSCHGDRNPSAGFTIELVEASVSVNLNKLRGIEGDVCAFGGLWDANIKAGRFVVPFGAFAAMSDPAVLRTVTNPLMFNMGRRVDTLNRQPVLPGPYADEGIDISVSGRFFDKITANADFFAVNGLQQQGFGVSFGPSRRYIDNNREPAVGVRTTVGTSWLRFGGSIMSGTAQNEGSPQFNYKLSGVDAVLRLRDVARVYFEYAIRTEDSIFVPGDQNHTYGIVVEGEFDVPCTQDFSFLVRYDTLEHRDAFFGPQTQERVTWGLNKKLSGGSMLMINHEHWLFGREDSDVIGARWSTTF